ncbi:epoxyqueuosine reductase [Fluviicoccus keumensis]|uniref:Epoxyqueuosine reductase n=1 Tax=Fluviicoccus keumensis TaxID=1435465 RepID=A0A4Q7ZA91_9GAMM|nr:tRNA epoxyqueuosine(34) reductase QueG [Fluviicoccus keumensis]RZU47014.1 epoxyqueuosine reductase [Fluviicoccus keumensis]
MEKIPTTPDAATLATLIRQWGAELGFGQVGISGLDLGDHGDHLQRWLDKGYQGEMAWMASHGEKRWRPELLVEGVQSIISVRLDYLVDAPRHRHVPQEPATGVISRYARGRDYHKTLRKRLQQLADRLQTVVEGSGHRVFVDSAPVLERAVAEQAGLGWIGKNTMLIHRQAGSFFFLGELFTTLALPRDEAVSSHCGSCRACLDICPTQAFTGPYELDARRCISYLTIEYQGSIPVELRPLIGNRIFGCDDCQLICPWNRYAKLSAEADFRPRHGLENSPLWVLFGWTEEEFLRKTEGSPLRRTGYENFLRNIAVGLGNAPRLPEVLAALTARKEDESAMVREHVAWALQRHAD